MLFDTGYDDVQGRRGSRRAGDDAQVVQASEQFLAWGKQCRASASPCSQSRQVPASSHQQYTDGWDKRQERRGDRATWRSLLRKAVLSYALRPSSETTVTSGSVSSATRSRATKASIPDRALRACWKGTGRLVEGSRPSLRPRPVRRGGGSVTCSNAADAPVRLSQRRHAGQREGS